MMMQQREEERPAQREQRAQPAPVPVQVQAEPRREQLLNPHQNQPMQNLDFPDFPVSPLIAAHSPMVQNRELNYPVFLEEKAEDTHSFESFKILTELRNQNDRFLLLDDVFQRRGPVIKHIPGVSSMQQYALSEDTIFEITQPNVPTSRFT